MGDVGLETCIFIMCTYTLTYIIHLNVYVNIYAYECREYTDLYAYLHVYENVNVICLRDIFLVSNSIGCGFKSHNSVTTKLLPWCSLSSAAGWSEWLAGTIKYRRTPWKLHREIKSYPWTRRCERKCYCHNVHEVN